jgi:hypothetical protein
MAVSEGGPGQLTPEVAYDWAVGLVEPFLAESLVEHACTPGSLEGFDLYGWPYIEDYSGEKGFFRRVVHEKTQVRHAKVGALTVVEARCDSGLRRRGSHKPLRSIGSRGELRTQATFQVGKVTEGPQAGVPFGVRIVAHMQSGLSPWLEADAFVGAKDDQAKDRALQGVREFLRPTQIEPRMDADWITRADSVAPALVDRVMLLGYCVNLVQDVRPPA